MEGMGQEAKETKEMANSFFKLLESKLDLQNRKTPPSQEEVKAAIEQLKDIGRFSVFTTISILPGGGFSLIGLEILARKFGVKSFTFIPSAFRKKDVEKQDENIDQDQLPDTKTSKTENKGKNAI
jgi:copper homeostasis protein CutC